MVMVPAHEPDLLSAAQLGPGKFAFVFTEISLLKAASRPCAGAVPGSCFSCGYCSAPGGKKIQINAGSVPIIWAQGGFCLDGPALSVGI